MIEQLYSWDYSSPQEFTIFTERKFTNSPVSKSLTFSIYFRKMSIESDFTDKYYK